jgi:hypothetical protein
VTDDFGALVRVLTDSQVEFILVGGFAATAHGSARATFDLDIVYSRSSANLARIVSAVGPLSPYLRGAPPGLPFQFDVATLKQGLNFTLTTTLGPLDLLGEIAGGGGYDALLPYTLELRAFGVACRCLTLGKLIEVKRAAGRPKDLESVAELELLRDEAHGD